MKNILLFGAGKSATVLIDYFKENAKKENWFITVVDADLALAQSKTGNASFAKAISFDINLEEERKKYISQADIVISLLPPALHTIVARTCIDLNKNLLTASYVDDEIRKLESEIKNRDLIFLCEMGLDPGIDHMSAMQIIDGIRKNGGEITSFQSHCGGLVAPESDDNPWHYKISWNPRNILLAGKAGAHYKLNGQEIREKYEELFDAGRMVDVPSTGFFSWYPNRDSLSYAPLYGLEKADTFIRTTLRHPDFMYGWKNVVELKLTDETPQYQSDGRSLMDVFKEHMDKNGFGEWMHKKLTERLDASKELLENLMKLAEAEDKAENEGQHIEQSFMAVDEKGDLENMDLDEIKNNAAATVAHKMHEANLTLKQLFYLGMDDSETKVNKGFCSPADVMQLALEKKLALQPGDKDMIVMMHEIEYKKFNDQKTNHRVSSWLVVKGEDSLRTAMAKTVGLPLGIAAKLILNGTITVKGLHIPVKKEIYDPVLKELEKHGIRFQEEEKIMS